MFSDVLTQSLEGKRMREGCYEVNMKVHMDSSSMALEGKPFLISSYAWKASIHAQKKAVYYIGLLRDESLCLIIF